MPGVAGTKTPALGRRVRRWLRRAALLLVLGGIALTAMHQHVVMSAGRHVYTADTVPAADAIIVLGARIHADGTPYPMLADRLRTAASLWHDGKARQILLSGDGLSSPGYDASSKLYYAEPACLEGLEIPDSPTAADVQNAVAQFDDVFGEFPFAPKRISRANWLAYVLTPFVPSARLLFHR